MLIFLKLGGSLITDKRHPETPRLDVIERLAAEIAQARQDNPDLQLVIGHGAGSFGHPAGNRYGTRHGVHTPNEWFGFAITADAAARLNRIVTGALLAAGVPAWSIQPSVALRCEDGAVVAGPADTVAEALARGLTPVVFGDVALDRVRGGTIASTEEIFDWLAEALHPHRIILAGEVSGVYTGDPQLDTGAQLIPEISSANLAAVRDSLGGSFGIDVTGGMAAKVIQSVKMAERHPGLKIVICSGLQPGTVHTALSRPDAQVGTLICA